MNSKPAVLLAIDRAMLPTVFSETDRRRLGTLARVIEADPPELADAAFLRAHAGEAEIVLTSWGTAPFDAEVLAAAPRLSLVCHAAGSVRPVVTDAFWERGLRVTSGAAAIAYGVAEFCLGLMLTASKRVFWQAEAARRGHWAEAAQCFGGGFELYQQAVGIIGAGQIGRQLIRLLGSLTCRVLVYDPYLSAGEAAALGVTKVETLAELFRECRVVSLNAPTNEGTRDLLRGEHFALLRLGSVFINTAGSIQVHEEEFLGELRKGRFVACIDRCPVEPAPLDHPYRTLPNVVLTPHIAGVMAENRLRIGTFVVDEVERFVKGKPLVHEVTREALARLA